MENGTQLVSEAGRSMEGIVAQVQRVSDLIGEISSATSEQTTGISQVGEAVTQPDQVTSKTQRWWNKAPPLPTACATRRPKLAEVVSVFRLAS